MGKSEKNMSAETGQISIDAENILPIIKQWLYSEKEIFLRELVANAADAMHKLHKLSMLGEETRELVEFAITIACDREAKTLTISDTGVGMTADEVKRYINQVAFSGLQDFVAKYQDKEASQQVIGHFGLGFYSSFMVAKQVEIDTLSCRPNTEAVRWSCDGSIDFSLAPSERKEHGTSIILHISDEASEMLQEATLQAILRKYCAFIKYPVRLAGETVNDPAPLWTESPSRLGDKDYLDFYHKLFPTSPDPLFWIHLNVDYPFVLQGILYFPRLRHELDAAQGEVKLYCNQVFVDDNVKELIPEYLMLLKGALDCPDLPLNVSRSHLQNDQQVRKISQHIAKKVADRLVGMAKTAAEDFKKYWPDMHTLIKYGMLRDDAFHDKLLPHVIYTTTKGEFITLDAYVEKNKDKTEGKIVYASDTNAQAAYVQMFEHEGIDVLIADTLIDGHFMSFVEQRSSRKYSFQRIDSDITSNLTRAASKIIDPHDNKDESEKIGDLFRKALTRQRVKVKVESLKSAAMPAMLIFDENARRFAEMARLEQRQEYHSPLANEHTLVVNQSSGAIKKLLVVATLPNKEKDIALMVNQIYDLACLQHERLPADMMKDFIARSASILERMGGGGSGLIVEG